MKYTFLLSLATLLIHLPRVISNGILPILSSTSPGAIPNTYIVLFKKTVLPSVARDHINNVYTLFGEAELADSNAWKCCGAREFFYGVGHEFIANGRVVGYLLNAQKPVIAQVQLSDEILLIEQDSTHQLFTKSPFAVRDQAIFAEQLAPWGLSRISHRSPLSLLPPYKYLYSPNPGLDVDIYTIDTGIYTSHDDFSFPNRAFHSITIPSDELDDDEIGHGTHVAGTIVGTRFGVAKAARVFGVKVVRNNGEATISDIMKGVEFAVASHVKNVSAPDNLRRAHRQRFKGSVINMSLGVDLSLALNSVCETAVEMGLHVIVAAGNENASSCLFSPSSSPQVITVGASTFKDERAPFSNFGNCTDIFAPGVGIWSASIGFPWNVAIGEGTSMATPHVSGLVAYFLGLWKGDEMAEPWKVKEIILGIGTRGALSEIPVGTENLLAYNDGGGSDTGPPTKSPALRKEAVPRDPPRSKCDNEPPRSFLAKSTLNPFIEGFGWGRVPKRAYNGV